VSNNAFLDKHGEALEFGLREAIDSIANTLQVLYGEQVPQDADEQQQYEEYHSQIRQLESVLSVVLDRKTELNPFWLFD
jgi:hypothetical protein